MPRDLVSAPIGASDWLTDVGRENYETEGMWKSPPKNYARWTELVYQLVRHCVERYGRAEVEQWYFEVWNEPNLPNYWKGTFEEYCRLYDHSVAGATRALPTVKIGGPAMTRPGLEGARDFLARFLEHCTSGTNYVTGQHGTQLDFVSFHTKGAHYSQRRIYNPYLSIEHECPSSRVMMDDIRCGLETIARFPQLKHVPVFVDECDPAVGTIYGVHDNPNFIITNTPYYPNFVCALIKRILDLNARFENPVALMTTWAFYFEGKRFFEGNRTLVTNENIEKPILNAFRMLRKLGTTRVQVTSNQARDVLDAFAPPTEVDALAAVAGERVTVLVWHQCDEWWRSGEAQVQIRVKHLPFAGRAVVRRYQVDDAHSNAYAEWVRHGSPQNPTDAQIQQIKNRQGLELWESPRSAQVADDGSLTIDLQLPLFGTGLIEIEEE
jgi:xylan 1,4-beta-xylosidase